jgi:hypothetical protein
MHSVNRDAKRILLICQLDTYSNGVKPIEIQRFLQQRGHVVRLVDTSSLSQTPNVWGLALLAVGAAWAFIIHRWNAGQRRLSYYVLVADYHLRRRLLSSLPLDDFDLVICETAADAGVLRTPTSAQTLFDCPTPWADEMYFEGRLTDRQHRKLRRLEMDVLERVDHLAFWWPSYAQYALKHYGISGRNLITLNYGCTPEAHRAGFSDPPRVAYLGFLGQRFIDLGLLSRLTKLYPHIDVYGGPPPDPSLGLNYLGYASPEVLQHYQLGLITCTRDELRREGFSAKHLQYLAYGLPVLVPAWRRHLDLLHGSVPYEEETFASAVRALSNEEEWRRRSDAAYAQAQRLTWDVTLRPLERVLLAPSRRDG